MSIECLNQAIKTEGLSPTRKLILIILANYADEHGSCFPSYKHIAKIVGLKDHKGVQRVIKEFERAGLLRIEHRREDDGGQTSNRYHLSLNPSPKGAVTPLPPVVKPPNTKEDTKVNTYSVMFEKFWKVYPRKVGKFDANKAFSKLLKKKPSFFIDLMAVTENYARVCKIKGTDQEYILHASTYLNKKRYEDYGQVEKHIKKVNSINKIAG